ncbi:MAG: hypothetical protein NVSMB46_03470 [Candidatus Saccharimonadales bacterium]
MAMQKSINEIGAGWHGYDRPKDGEHYQHYKGGTYLIVATGFLEDSQAPCVVYRSVEKNIVWVRTAKNFLEFVEYNSSKTQRFTRLNT